MYASEEAEKNGEVLQVLRMELHGIPDITSAR